jgi:hypothetical protein
VGALYIGLLYFLYRKVVALEKSLHETMLEMKKIMTLLDSDDRLLQDEPLPPGWVSGSPKEEEEEEDLVDRITETLSNFHVTTLSEVDENEEEEVEDQVEEQVEEEEGEQEEEEIPKVEELSFSPLKEKPKRKKAAAPKKPKEKMVILFEILNHLLCFFSLTRTFNSFPQNPPIATWVWTCSGPSLRTLLRASWPREPFQARMSPTKAPCLCGRSY